ncbi:Laccase [Trichinella pseudospiralis]
MKKRMTRSRVEKKPNEGSSMGLYSAGLFRGGAVCCSFPHTAAVEYFGCGGDQPAQPSGTPADHHCPTTCTFHLLTLESCVPEVEVSTQNGSYTSIYSRR